MNFISKPTAVEKIMIFIFPFIIASPVYSQQQELYHLTFSDTTNFNITTSLHNKRPDTIYVLDTTESWNPKRFWLEEFDRGFINSKKRMERDEHHPYFHTYLFGDKELDKRFSKKEKKDLSKQSAIMVSKTLHLNGSSYKTISATDNLTGFYFISTEPIFSSDGKYAFIDLGIYHKEFADQPFQETYFGKTCIIFEKQDNQWRKIKVFNHLIL